MTRRQSAQELAEALIPTNHVRILWHSAGTAALQQVTGLIVATTPEVVQVVPHQNGQGKVRVINRDRVHSAVVTKAGDYTHQRRQRAMAHLQYAAGHIASGNAARAKAEIHLAADLVPGLLES